jgi:hypothetical protein
MQQGLGVSNPLKVYMRRFKLQRGQREMPAVFCVNIKGGFGKTLQKIV